jgi:hypothetical protein
MSRISKGTREQMARALVKHRFDEKAQELCAESAALFNAVLDERYDAATQKLMRQLEKRQPGAFSKTDDLYVRAQGMRVTIGATTIGKYDIAIWIPETKERAVLHKDEGEPSTALAERIAKFAMATKDFTEQLVFAHRRALGALEQFTTAKALTEGWPEAMPVIGHLLAVEDRALPAVQLEAINDEFGLPPSEQIAA